MGQNHVRTLANGSQRWSMWHPLCVNGSGCGRGVQVVSGVAAGGVNKGAATDSSAII